MQGLAFEPLGKNAFINTAVKLPSNCVGSFRLKSFNNSRHFPTNLQARRGEDLPPRHRQRRRRTSSAGLDPMDLMIVEDLAEGEGYMFS